MNLKTWYREPLLQFLVIGGVLFGVVALFKRPAIEDRRVEVSAEQIVQLGERWQRQWMRPPTEKELRGLVEDSVKQEILYREALAMGLDRDDLVIRRRLAQQIELLANDLAAQIEPTDNELATYLEENAEKYQVPARISFSHVYFSVDRRGAQAEGDAQALLDGLRAGSVPSGQHGDLGDPLMLQSDYSGVTSQETERLFGTRFAEGVFELEPGSWQGPVASSYGLHLVRVVEKTEPRAPDLDEARDRLRLDWMDERRREMNEAFYASLRERYEIHIDESALNLGE